MKRLERQYRRLPAWLYSIVLHTVLVCLLPLLIEPLAISPAAKDREVGIVLSRADAAQTEYYQDEPVDLAEYDASPADTALPTAETFSPPASVELRLPSMEMPALELPLAGEMPAPEAGRIGRVPTKIDGSGLLAEEARRRERVAAAGPQTELSLFGGAPAVGRSFVFLIDRSKSMGGQGLDALVAAEEELMRSLASLQPMHRFQVIAYHHKCVYLGPRKLLIATPENVASVKGHLSGIAAFGSTSHDQAIMSALNMRPDVIFVLTDGGDPALTAGELKRIRRVAGSGTSIHCIQFGWGPRQDTGRFLERLAAENNGRYGYVDMSEE